MSKVKRGQMGAKRFHPPPFLGPPSGQRNKRKRFGSPLPTAIQEYVSAKKKFRQSKTEGQVPPKGHHRNAHAKAMGHQPHTVTSVACFWPGQK